MDASLIRGDRTAPSSVRRTRARRNRIIMAPSKRRKASAPLQNQDPSLLQEIRHGLVGRVFHGQARPLHPEGELRGASPFVPDFRIGIPQLQEGVRQATLPFPEPTDPMGEEGYLQLKARLDSIL
jgi:hypothetical protein